MAKFVGGPKDGIDLEATSSRVVFPAVEDVRAVWYEADEWIPCQADPLTGLPRMDLPVKIINHIYERGADGRYYYMAKTDS